MVESAVLYSGGKDSSYALHTAQQETEVTDVVTVHAEPGSYMYHVPASEVAATAADAMTATHTAVDVEGDDELQPVEDALSELDVDAVYTGAVESEYQRSRVDDVARRLDVEHRAPLWHRDPEDALREIADTYEVVVTAVAADGLTEDWLGRKLDTAAVEEILELRRRKGVHPLGEGGEYESLAVAGPHLDFRIEIEYSTEWDGVRGELEVEDCWIERN